MEAFSLLKYWRGGGGGAGNGVILGSADSTRATTVLTALAQNSIETDDDDDNDDGPFFDLEFTVPDDDEKERNDSESDEDDDDGADDEFNFTLSSGSSNDRVDQTLALSPSDDLFFKGRLVPIEPSSVLINGSDPNSKPQFPVSLMKSATKFRVFMLGFKKSKLDKTAAAAAAEANNEPANSSQMAEPEEEEEITKQSNSKFFTVKFKVEEVPLVSLFTRDNSKSANKSHKQINNNTEHTATSAAATNTTSFLSSDDKRFSKDVMQKYLKKVKPLYIRVSKRYGDKLKFSGQLSLVSGLKQSAAPPPSTAAAPPKTSPTAEKKQPEAEIKESATSATLSSNVKSLKQAGLRVVCKHLGKSRSASSAVAAVPPSSSSSVATAPVVSKRRDDSLLQQQDGIQSAILHCKRSFNASRDSDSSLLSRSVSDPSHEKSIEFSRKSSGVKGKVSVNL
ncbi:probable membrane-associated kinase regulator 2 [Mercurialis annua]|uniref:probable membrane-associated kinase regulator 2 n=1 Tax=Mercurialis annua TaxID=3986 RepID=UPI00215FFE11|nr:probable membrane-associated kinase regulator 2 [Mercurialis annua]